MSEYLVKGETLTAIADAVRSKVGTTASMSLEAMTVQINSLVIKTTTTVNVVPDTTSSFTYDGSVKTPVWRNFDSEQLTISGDTSATNAGTYKVYFTPKADYEWPDGTVDPREVQWSIGRKAISTVPSQSGTLTYTGSSLTPSWSNYDSSQMTIGGTTSGTNAGSYTATFTPNSNHKWSDGSTTEKSVSWSIAKATGSLSLSATSGTIEGKNKTMSFTVTRVGDGKISVSSSNTGVATVAVSGTTVTVTSKAYGSTTITVSVAEGTNHEAPNQVTYAVTVDYAYLYKNGDQKASITGGWYTVASQIGNVAYNANSITVSQTQNAEGFVECATRNKIDLTNCKAIKINVTGFSGKGKGHFAISNSFWSATRVAEVSVAGSGTITLDVSAISGSYYVSLWGYWSPTWNATFDKVYLTE